MRARQGIGEQLAAIVVCVDDTDDETKSTSTGKVAGCIADRIRRSGGRIRLGITRHQLLLRDDVPYTSHNSSMTFEAIVPECALETLRQQAIEEIVSNSVPSADPGLAFAVLPSQLHAPTDAVQDIERLVEFGQRAKMDYCAKESAFRLAESIPWVTLSEHGGNGQGVVGALAGVGLRISGSDGRFRGKCDLAKFMGTNVAATAPAKALAEELSQKRHGPVRIVDVLGNVVPDSSDVVLVSEAKAVYQGGSLTIICSLVDGTATPLAKEQMEKTGDDGAFSRACNSFEWDNDVEECLGAMRSCRNCLHRRWESIGFSCMLGEDSRRL